MVRIDSTALSMLSGAISRLMRIAAAVCLAEQHPLRIVDPAPANSSNN
jgi:hypothetical protein